MTSQRKTQRHANRSAMIASSIELTVRATGLDCERIKALLNIPIDQQLQALKRMRLLNKHGLDIAVALSAEKTEMAINGKIAAEKAALDLQHTNDILRRWLA